MAFEYYIFIGMGIAIVGSAIVIGILQNKKKPAEVKPEDKPGDKPIDIPLPSKLLKWTDRRPIGMVMLAVYKSMTGHENFMNGETPLSEWLVQHANNCITYMRQINAQGLLVWDPEGAKFPRPYTYYGDPTLAQAEIDIFFKMISGAGFKTGICIRPDKIQFNRDGWPIHFTVKSPFKNLVEKVEYARRRWGCTLFYVDSNVGEDLWKPVDEKTGVVIQIDNTVGAGNLISGSVFKELSALYPDCLFIPEHQDNEYYLYTAPFNDKNFRHLLNPDEKGFQVLSVAFDESPTWSPEELKESVEQGNILMGRVWYPSPELPTIKQAYDKAKIDAS